MSTKGRLKRCFPESAIDVPLDVFNTVEFQSTLAATLTRMSHQEVIEMQPTAKKAGQQHVESRDTTNPKAITDLLMSFLEAVGTPASVFNLWKHTREEVSWSNRLLPWRRSPMWLLTRVALQTTFSRLSPSKNHYKEFMIYFMARIVSFATEMDVSCDLLHCLVSKVSGRLSKLGNNEGQPWFHAVEDILRIASDKMDTVWKSVNASEPKILTSNLRALNFEQDSIAQLCALDEYIDFVKHPPSIDASLTSFRPPALTARFTSSTLPTIQPASSPEVLYVLAGIEAWVASELSTWLGSRLQDDETCELILALMQQYHDIAAAQYKGNPESLSRMLLTCAELWIACDKTAVQHHQLLRSYDPAVPLSLLQSLVLPLKADMARLLRVEDYVQERNAHANNSYPSVFSGFGLRNSFANKHYATSPRHQILLTEIKQWAQVRRDEKKAELRQLKKEYAGLMKSCSDSVCEYKDVWDAINGHPRRIHSGSCQHCAYESKAASMIIDIDEWPLPDRELEAQAVVFEIDCPKPFNDWRNATLFVILDVLKSEHSLHGDLRSRYDPSYCLSTFIKTSPQRLRLISECKPHVVTHRRFVSVSIATESAICVNNGLSYKYYDSKSDCLVAEMRVTEDVPRMCTYQLQLYKPLQEYIYRPHFRPNGPGPNVVIASQHDCPLEMSLEEFKSLGTLPLGLRLQWSNILLQLSLPSIDFKKMDTLLVLLQVVGQAGPRSSPGVARDGHGDLCEAEFGRKLSVALHTCLGRIKENWESRHALEIFIAISTRLLSLTDSEEVAETCRTYLRRCREVSLGWAKKIRTMARDASQQDQRDELLCRAFEIALVCTNTFDVDLHHLKVELQQPLLQQPSHSAVFVQCSLMICETSHAALDPGDTVQCIAHQRWRRLSSRALPLLLAEITEMHNDCIDIAIGDSWSDYSRGSGWKSHLKEAEHWVTTATMAEPGIASQTVDYNLLSGELRVDGLPLSRLPSEFEAHPMYKILFDRSTVEVMRTNMAGMQFSAMNLFRGYKIFFGLQHFPGALAGQNLMVTCVKDNERCALVPPRIFLNKLPDHFVIDYVHWYNYGRNTVEFRPIADPWKSVEAHWLLSKEDKGWILTRGENAKLASMTSPTGMVISKLFNSLECSKQIHLIFRPSQGYLDIELPRLKLGFMLKGKDSEVASRQFRGMYLDSCQGIGTLVGLKSKSVLRNDENDRIILIPNGEVTWKSTPKHIQVEVQNGSSTKVYPFELDTLVGRILDNGTLESKLALCYFHALTSFCLPDKLTSKTGTESAIEILKSAAVRSFNGLSEHNTTKLHEIAGLTPRRQYYPEHERLMQQVEWVRDLSFLSQHGQLYTEVTGLLGHVASLDFFHGNQLGKLKDVDRGDPFLIDRDLIRSSMFRSSGSGAERHTASHDRVYYSRSRNAKDGVWSSRYDSAFRTARRIHRGLQTGEARVSPGLANRMWDLLRNFTDKPMRGAPDHLGGELVTYDAKWFEDWRLLLGQSWCHLHRTLAGARPDRFCVMMFMATLAYARDVSPDFIGVLIGLYNVTEIGHIQIPEAMHFDLSKGRVANAHQLTASIERHAIPFRQCPEYGSPREASETSNETWDRRERVYEAKKKQVIASIVKNFVNVQWPCETFQKPIAVPDIDTYINMNAAMGSVSYVKDWWDNHRFFQYLCCLEQAVTKQHVGPLPGSARSMTLPPSRDDWSRSWLTDDDLLCLPGPSPVPMTSTLPTNLTGSDIGGNGAATQDLMRMITRLQKQADKRHEKEYVADLEESSNGLQAHGSRQFLKRNTEQMRACLLLNVTRSETHLARVYTSLTEALSYKTHLPVGGIAARYNSPRVSPTFFLKQLAMKRWAELSSSWKQAIVTYGVAITDLQRARRLLSLRGNEADLVKELLNPGHENWSPHTSPESLLIEVESGILIRKVQAEIAEQMKYPVGDHNAVMQLNMGEGKSSVIVPIAAAAMADGTQLVRVVVGKPQSKQMLQMLVSKVGGLCNRQVYHMPFSRSLQLDLAQVNIINQTYRECMETGGILLVQPEHILSFQLMGIESTLARKHEISQSLLNTQNFFKTQSRDIVDESDENFSVKFELVYTMGTQRSIDLSPGRWCLIQTILCLIRRIVPTIQQDLPSSVEVVHGIEGSFPRTRILRQDAQERLCLRLAEEICSTGLPEFPIARQSEPLRKAVFSYVTKPDLSRDEILAVEGQPTFWTDAIKRQLLLMRGLIGGGVLAFAFGQKRWRVNYGLTPARRPETRLAVPFRAKDSPALRSEFSHPDVVIVLTCLSYYYGGLDDADLFTAFEHLIKSDQAENEYEEWVRDAPYLPTSFHNLIGINLKDRHQCIHEIFPCFRYAQAVVDFFLAHIVFPKEMKEFPHKLSASGWDIGQTKTNPTTGFSGTNDSKHLLPLSVDYLDLDEQRHTNSLVLLHLLQPENRVELMPPSSAPQCSDAVRLLQLAVKMEQPAQVILDVGAQVIELSNIEVAAEWLKMTASNQSKKAVVFFDESDNLCICDRAGHVEAFQTSPYSKQLDVCYVFLDEAHTRGTDLKLPQDYRAVVTLGAGLTKDRLVQGM